MIKRNARKNLSGATRIPTIGPIQLSALVAIRALFGVIPVRRNAKHIVALDANAMQHRLRVIACLRSRRRMFVAFGAHARILP
jgi:hypothetical protein